MKAFYSFSLNDEHSSGVVAMRFTSTRQALLFLILASVLALAACGKSDTGKVAASAGRSDAQETRTEAEKTKDEEHGKGGNRDAKKNRRAYDLGNGAASDGSERVRSKPLQGHTPEGNAGCPANSSLEVAI